MIKRFENKISMYETVFAYLNDNDSIVSRYSGISAKKQELQLKIDELYGKENLKMNVFRGKTNAKNDSRDEIITLGLAFSAKLFDYAKKTGNEELKSQSDFNRSDFAKVRDTLLISNISHIMEITEANLDALVDYGITQQNVDDFKSHFNAYRNKLESRFSSEAIKISVNKSMTVLFKEIDLVLKGLDKMLEEFYSSDYQFYIGYKSARQIKDLGLRHKTGEAKPSEKNTGNYEPPKALLTGGGS